jgi:glycosyltransferase involved in cell wall biosynthesis
MKIAMVSEHASPLATLGGVDAGGQNVHVAALAAALAHRGHRVSVYTRRDSPGLPERVSLCPGVTVVHVPAGPPEPVGKDDLLPFMPAFGRWLADHWRVRGAPDVVHAHFWMSGLAALDAAADTSRLPVVQTFHALGSVKRRYQGERDTSPGDRIALEAEIAARADMIIATCSDEVSELATLGAPVHSVSVVPCGVDIDLFTPRRPSPGRWTDRPHRLLSVGRLVERKGIDTVIEALKNLPDTELWVAGGPPACRLDTDPEARRLLHVADRCGVRARVRLLGSVRHTDLPELMSSADAVVCTPWYEPFGIVPVEAAACGRPVVGSAVGGLLDTVVDGVTGLLIGPRDPDLLSHTLRGLLADPARRLAMGAAGRRRAEHRYSWASVARDTESAYRSVVRATAAERVTAV